MNKELSSLNHNEPVSIYRRGEGGRERGRGEGDHVVLKGNRGGINRLEQSLMVDCGKLTSNGVGGVGGMDYWNTPEPYGRDSVNFTLSFYHF